MNPKTLGQLIREAVQIYREKALPLIGIVAMAQIPLILLDSLISANELAFTELGLSTIIGLAQYVVLAILTAFAVILMYGAFVHAISRHVEGSEINVVRAYEVAWQKLRPLGGTGFLTALAILGMALTVIGIPLAVYFAVKWAFAVPVVMLENSGPRDSIKRSSYLVKGKWLRVAGVMGLFGITWVLIGGLLSGVAGLSIELALGLVTDNQPLIAQTVGIVGGLAWVAVTPLFLIGLTLVYWDLRVRKEGVDRETIAEELDFIPTEDLGPGFELAANDSSDELVEAMDGAPGRATNRFTRKKRRQELELRIRRSLSGRRSWIAVAAVAAVLIVGYYGILTARYLQASDEREALNTEITRISRLLRRPSVQASRLELQLNPKLSELEELREAFTYPNSDFLVGILSQTASEIPVELTSIAIGSTKPTGEGAIRYQAQPMTITLKGSTQQIYRFIDSLHQKVIVTSISNLRMGNVSGEAASAQVGLEFLLDPQQVFDAN